MTRPASHRAARPPRAGRAPSSPPATPGEQRSARFAARCRSDRSGSAVRGLPITPLLTYQPEDGVHYAVTAVDARGRLADASPVRAVGWSPGQAITLHVVAGAVIVINRTPADAPGRDSITGPRAARAGRTAITQQGHLRLPATIRHQCRLRSGSRLLVAAHPTTGVLAAFTTRVLDNVLRTYYQSLTDPDGARPATSDSATDTHRTPLRDGQR